MKMYKLHLNQASETDYLSSSLYTKGISVFKSLKTFSGFVTLIGDTIVLHSPNTSGHLIRVPNVFPLSYCYKVDTSTLEGVMLSQMLSAWARLESHLKDIFKIEPEDSILYFESLERSLFVKTQFNSYTNRQGMTKENSRYLLGELRSSAFHDDMVRMAKSLASQVERESNAVRKLMTTNRLRNVVQVCENSGIQLPRTVVKLINIGSMEDDDECGQF